MKVMVNGVEKELEYIVASGCDMAQEIILEYESLSINENENCYIMTQNQYEWWTDEIDKLIEIDDLLINLDLFSKDYGQYLNETNGCDLETQTDMQLKWLKEYRKNH